MIKSFDDIFEDRTKNGCKIKTDEYCDSGLHIIIDQGQDQIAGYTDMEEGLFVDVPAIVFGDHTRIIKYVDEPFFLGADGVKVLSSKLEDANYKYLYYALKNVRIPNTGYNRHFKWLKEASIRYPGSSEQESIVRVLDKVSSMITSRQEMLKKFDELIKSRFVEMFGDPKLNPKGFRTCQMGEHIEFLTSGSRGWARYCVEDGAEWFITIKNVKDCHILLDSIQPINAPNSMEAKRTRVEEGDLLISITADLGRTGVVTKEIADYGAYINQHLTCIRLSKDVLEPLYVAYYMESEAGKEQFAARNQTGVKAGLNFEAIKSLKLIVPPKGLQKDFVSFVNQVDKSKADVQKSLDEMRLVYDSLMQIYFQ
ncbi:MAG: restriction endonuclease subunit S [Firmicutes bacterium]|nr:restriction endonuclease subunit S [Bacillota bacterium]